MNIFKQSTLVTYPSGSTEEESKILFADLYDDADMTKVIIVTENTPLHPIDHAWPDQPADKGTVDLGFTKFPILNVVTGAYDTQSGNIFWENNIKARKGQPDWYFLVGHVISVPQGYDKNMFVDQKIILRADKNFRKKINASHTGCHLMSLALNKSTKSFWKKEAKVDSLGNPNLDQLTIQHSSIFEDQCIDHYRLGKSVRKSGLETNALLESIDSIQKSINSQLSEWVRTRTHIYIDAPSPFLDSMRWWHCVLDGHDVTIPCGGTHLTSLAELDSVEVRIEIQSTEPEFTVFTKANVSQLNN